MKQKIFSRHWILWIVFLVGTGCGGSSSPCPQVDIANFSIWINDLTTGSEEGNVAIFSIRPRENASEITSFQGGHKLRVALFSSAQASQECVKTFTQNIVGIKVISENDFNENHPAGTALNDLIKVKQYGVFSGSIPFQGLDDIFPVSYMSVYNFVLGFYLAERPTSNSVQKFTVEIELDDGSVHKLQTEWMDFNLAN